MALGPLEERLRSLIQTLPIILWTTDEHGVVTLSEGGGLVRLDAKPGQMVGMNVRDLYPDNADVLRNLDRVLGGDSVTTVTELGRMVLESRLHPMRDETGKIVGCIGIGIDVTEKTRAERAMRGHSRRFWSLLEEDRRRIARELHDEVGQTVTALKLELDVARTLEDLASVRDRLARAAGLASRVVDELRRVVHDLRPGALEELGLAPAVKALVDRFQSSTGIPTSVEIPKEIAPLDHDVETAVYRFVQEALTNITQHASAHAVKIEMGMRPDRLNVTVEDDGCGFVPEAAAEGRHFGLTGILDRARILGGAVTIDSSKGRGTRLYLSLPKVVVEATS